MGKLLFGAGLEVGPPRPTGRSREVRDEALRELLKRVIEWLGGDYDPSQEAETLKALGEATEWKRDGYEIARELERDGWSPDSDLVDTLDGWWGIEYEAVRKAVEKWVSEYNVEPPLKVGDRVRCKYGHETIEGVIDEIKTKRAEYLVKSPAIGKVHGSETSRAIIHYEDAELIETQPEQSETVSPAG